MPDQEQVNLKQLTPDVLIPKGKGVLLFGESDYRISDRAVRQLDNYVADLKTHPRGELVGKIDFEDWKPMLDRRKLVDSLPEGLSEARFVDSIRLSFHVESATDSYADVFYQSGRRFRQLWLSGFTEDIWVPDELEHKDPFKRVLLEFGYSEEELDHQGKNTKEKVYEHTSGSTPVQMTMFGVIQEEITDVWHGLTGFILKKAAPKLAEAILKVKRRETFHKIWYRDLTTIQVIDNPELRHQAIETVALFEMPGNKIVPMLQEGAVNLMPVMGKDFRELERGLIRLISGSLANNTQYLGEAVLDLMSRKSQKMGVTTASLAKRVSTLPGVGAVVNLIVGQTVQQRESMKPKSASEKLVWEITTPIRYLILRKTEGLEFVI